MTLHTLRLCAHLRTSAEPVRADQDRSLASVLWLLLFLVFAPMIGVHVAFMLLPDAAQAQTVQSKSSLPGQHG